MVEEVRVLVFFFLKNKLCKGSMVLSEPKPPNWLCVYSIWEVENIYSVSFFPFIHFCIKVRLYSSFAEHWNKTKDLFAWRPGICFDGWCSSLPFSKSCSSSICSKYSRTFTSSSKLDVSCCVWGGGKEEIFKNYCFISKVYLVM